MLIIAQIIELTLTPLKICLFCIAITEYKPITISV